MRTVIQKRFRYSQLSLVLGLVLFTAGCGNPTNLGKSATPAPPEVIQLTDPKSAQIETPSAIAPIPHGKLSFYTVDHYGDDRNVEDDLKMTMAKAAIENKRILLQVGGDWCGWCKLLTAFIEKEEPVRSALERNYLLMKVTYTQKQTNEAFLSKYPKIKGYPHLFVLNADGSLLHSQDTTPLEEGKGYSQERVLAFLESWKL